MRPYRYRRRNRRGGPAATLLLAAALALPGPARAADTETGDSEGRKSDPKSGSTYRVRLNPDVTLTVPAAATIEEFLTQIVDALNADGGGAYTASLLPDGRSFRVLRADGSEIDNFHIEEDDDRIQSIRITLNRPGLRAVIGRAREAPSGGTIRLTLNGTTIDLSTAGLATAADVDAALLQAIRNAGFAAALGPASIVVHRQIATGDGLTQLGWVSQDAAIKTSALALEPEAAGVPLLGPGAIAALLFLLGGGGAWILGRGPRRRAARRP